MSSHPGIRFDGFDGSDQERRDTVYSYLGASAEFEAGVWVRPTNVRLANIEVVPPGEVGSGDNQLTSVVGWTMDGVYFHDWIDGAFEDGTGNNHVECLQVGGCQGLHIHRSHFVRGTTHGLFVRAWSASDWVPPQTIQDLVLDRCVFEGAYSPSGIEVGTPDVQIIDDLADPELGATSATVVGCAFAHGLNVDVQNGRAVIRGNKIASVTRYGLNLWQAAGYDVADNVYGEVTGNPPSSPFPGDVIDPSADFTTPNLDYGWYGYGGSTPPPDPGQTTCPTCGQPLPSDRYLGELAPMRAAWPAMPDRPRR